MDDSSIWYYRIEDECETFQLGKIICVSFSVPIFNTVETWEQKLVLKFSACVQNVMALLVGRSVVSRLVSTCLVGQSVNQLVGQSVSRSVSSSKAINSKFGT